MKLKMSEIKGEGSHHEHLIIAEDKAPDVRPTSRRAASLDIFRGFTVALMILVDDAGGEWPMISHAPWNGCNLADLVMPFFLFIVGVAISLALKRIPNRLLAIRKVVFRSLKLIFWGILLQGGFSHAPDELTYGVDVRKLRWCGILQRISIAYFVVALVEISIKDTASVVLSHDRSSMFKFYRRHWIVGACILVTYLSVLYGTYVPDWHFTVQNKDSTIFGKILTVSCNARGMLDPPCNAAGYVDRKVLGVNHMYQHPAWKRTKTCTLSSPHEGPFRADAPSWCYAPFEPEGILSSISSILSTIIGVHFGHVLTHFREHSSRLKHWLSMGVVLLVIGIALHCSGAMPLNKMMYTFSYVCVSSGAAVLVLSAFYVMVDMWGFKFPFLPLEWIGMNAMLVYVMAAEGIFAAFVNGWYFDNPKNNLVNWIKGHVFILVWHSERVGVLLYVIFAKILFWAVVSGVLHRFRIYWKL